MRYGGDNRGRLLIIVLLVTSLFLITLDLRGVQVIDGLRTGTQTALTPVQKAGSWLVSPFRNFLSDVTHLGRTRNKMEKLTAENEKLRLTLQNRKTADAQLKQLKGVLNLAGTAGYEVVNAKVISQGSTTSFTQTITIDAGTSSGVRANMTVLSGYGLVGVVKYAYRDSALVQLASDPAFKIGARIAGTQQIGILSGQGTRKGVLQLLDNTTQVRKGDALLARGSQNGRPFVPGVPIGEVTSVDNSPGAVTQTADVKFYTNFSTLGVVAVVVSGSSADPRDSLVPPKPRPTPLPTVTIYATPGAVEPTPTPTATK
ncbi:rod shape-determining protein MreC [Candidatus Planktophila dulcis]|uniref:Cell shape-determining protein MreC n=1 Tax=Candidatus Planktophila dulcis TaxID=1884914 RepID=A0AAC9YU18_9ACTN|nr:rod shape-determining protein MreC [Candidatus Planktophila dulcis]ASY12255.1 rod shape-determining protein MreC [Candidatus Planktophila dulcis]ASY14827.1 rod shape-determining protein MreC [Candidatus Planktophila dulcis]ASY21503.1 rod shape-determining protein MreC [Candidatus Planktophila dulcis]